MTDHDRLFKILLTTYFMDFLLTFLPEVACNIDSESVTFLGQEVFTDITSGEKHIADLIVQVKMKESDAFILIHIENQSKPAPDFPARMFIYFSRLMEKFTLPVYPIVIYSHRGPRSRIEPSCYELTICGKTVLKFEYTSIQLNRLPWRQFLNQPNPVTTALMTRMNIPKNDRPRVKLECLRLLATLKLDPAKSTLIGTFIETYLKLNAKELEVFEREFSAMLPEEKEATMELMTSWEKKGRQEGRQEGRQDGKEELLSLQIQQRFSTMPDHITKRLDSMTEDQLNELGKALFSFTSLTDLENWLSEH